MTAFGHLRLVARMNMRHSGRRNASETSFDLMPARRPEVFLSAFEILFTALRIPAILTVRVAFGSLINSLFS
jgi:hypothetical protein